MKLNFSKNKNPMPDPIYYVNGSYVKKENAYIHVNDIGLLRGYAVFDYLKTYHSKPFRLKDHLERLQNSAKYIGLKISKSNSGIAEICNTLLEKNGFAESNIRIVVTGGVGKDSKTKGESSLIITCEPRIVMDASFYTDGIRIKTVTGKREISFSKTCNYISAINNLEIYRNEGFSEVLYVLGGKIFECTSSNIFIIKGNDLITPSEEILYGITRKVIFETAGRLFKIIERGVMLDEALKADEVFISSTEREIMPVIGIDDKIIGNGKVGEKTKLLRSKFLEYVESMVWAEA
jgi:branched-chain amino acid aminotransferase